jgi:hypothetical protein
VSAKSRGSDRPPSAARSGRGSAADDKAPSPEAVEEPEQTTEQQEEQPVVDREETGQSIDRPASAGSRQGSRQGSRPASAGRPQSASREQTQDTVGGKCWVLLKFFINFSIKTVYILLFLVTKSHKKMFYEL